MPKSKKLVTHDAYDFYSKIHKTRHHLYPNENIVRLVSWFFKENKGCVLDYGCGDGCNTEFLLECGYDVCGIEITNKAIARVKERLKSKFLNKWSVNLIRLETAALPFLDNKFDFILAN